MTNATITEYPAPSARTPWESRLTDLSTLPAPGESKPNTYAALNMRIPQDGNLFDDTCLIARTLGEDVPQGALFAYLFRRFGYPNRGWDDHKELVNYTLSTPREDMFLRVSPYAGGSPEISFRFIISMDAMLAIRDYPYRHVNAHREAFLDWLERPENLPDWADAWMAEATTRGFLFPGQSSTFRTSVAGLQRMAYLDRDKEARDDRSLWIERMQSEFNALTPEPATEFRNMDWHTWSQEDPMKPYVQAAIQTLEDLKRPVWVRDCPITIYGCDGEISPEDTERPEADVALCAGYPSGELGNADPRGFAELHGVIKALGAGDPQAGISKALEILKGHLPR